MKFTLSSEFVLTCMGPKIEPLFYETLAALLKKIKISIGSKKILAKRKMDCVAISLSAKKPLDPHALTKALDPLNQQFGVDLIVQRDDTYALEKRLFVFDLESTLIQAEVLDELAKEIGIGEKIAGITRRAMNGEIPFSEALRERVSLLAGLPASRLYTLYKWIRFTEGAVSLVATLRKRGCKIAILTGGFDYFAERYKKRLKAHYAFANRLEIKNNKITGAVLGEIIDGPRKASLMEEIAIREGIGLHQVAAVGDGANDLPMLFKAGLGVAFHAKPAVYEAAPCRVTQPSLTSILHLLGLSEDEI